MRSVKLRLSAFFGLFLLFCKGLMLTFIIISFVGLSSCAPVQRWERGYLSDPMMIFNADTLETNTNQLIFDSREGSSGGYGFSGGGCACSP